MAWAVRERNVAGLERVPVHANVVEARSYGRLAAAVAGAGGAVVPGTVDTAARRNAAGEVGGVAVAADPGIRCTPDGREHVVRGGEQIRGGEVGALSGRGPTTAAVAQRHVAAVGQAGVDHHLRRLQRDAGHLDVAREQSWRARRLVARELEFGRHRAPLDAERVGDLHVPALVRTVVPLRLRRFRCPRW